MTDSFALCGDSAQILEEFPTDSAQLVLTDPPYARAHVELYRILAKQARRVMAPSGSLVTLLGHSCIHTVLNIFEDENPPDLAKKDHDLLRFRWLMCMWQPGAKAKLSMGVEVGWKPMLWYTKGPMNNAAQRSRGWVNDYVEVPPKGAGVKKGLHKWQQSDEWADYYIERLTSPGELVVDPFGGSGTVALAAAKAGRRFVTIDIDPDAHEVTAGRLREAGVDFCESL